MGAQARQQCLSLRSISRRGRGKGGGFVCTVCLVIIIPYLSNHKVKFIEQRPEEVLICGVAEVPGKNLLFSLHLHTQPLTRRPGSITDIHCSKTLGFNCLKRYS